MEREEELNNKDSFQVGNNTGAFLNLGEKCLVLYKELCYHS